MRVLDRIMIILFSITLIFTTIWVSIIPTIKNERFYERQLASNHLFEANDYTEEECEEIISCLLDYFFGNGKLVYEIDGVSVFTMEAINYARILKTTYIMIQVIGTVSFLLGIGLAAYLIWRFQESRKIMLPIVLITYGILLLITICYIGYIYLKGIPAPYDETFFSQMRYCYYTFIYFGNQDKLAAIPLGDNILSIIYDKVLISKVIVKTLIVLSFTIISWLFLTVIFRKMGNKIVEEIETIKYQNI